METEQDRNAAAGWVQRHHLQAALGPLLVARIALRRRARRLEYGTTVAVVALGVGSLVTFLVAAGEIPSPWTLAVYGAMAVLGLVGTALTHRWLDRGERRIGATLPQRVARATPVGPVTVLGVRYLWPFAAAHGLAVLLAGAVFVLDPAARFAAVVYAASVVALGTLTWASVLQVVRRPVVATDPATLAADDLLRREDARRIPQSGPATVLLVSGAVQMNPDAPWLLSAIPAAAATPVGAGR